MRCQRLALALVVVVLACAPPARGYWRATGAGTGSALTATFSAPVVTATGAAWAPSRHLSWSAASTSGGAAATAYVVRRVDQADGTSVPACGTSAAAPTTALSCDDTSVPSGTYRWVITASLSGWTSAGTSSALATDGSAPSVTVASVSPPANGNGYHAASPVTLVLNAADVGPAGVQSIGYRIDGGPEVAVAGTTASVAVSGDLDHTVTFRATDVAGNVSASGTHSVRIDTTPPTAAVTSFKAPAGVLTVVGTTDATTVTVSFCLGLGVLGLNLVAPNFSTCNPVVVTVTASGGSFTATTPVGLTASSWYARVVPQQDLAGNVGATAVVVGPPSLF